MVDSSEKRTLASIFSLGLTDGKARAPAVSSRLGLSEQETASRLAALERSGLISRKGSEVWLTEEGRSAIRVVFIGGGFEVIHSGHLYTIEQAKMLGDALVAVVARDSTIRKGKGREPVASEEDRVSLLSSIRDVDAAILGGTGNIYETLERVRPDVVALGYDQSHGEDEIAIEAERRGLHLKVVRLDSPKPAMKTTRLLREL